MLCYGPLTLGETERREAWLGDKLLGASVALEIPNHSPGANGSLHGKIVSNKYLASLFPEEFDVPYAAVHAKGTAIECAIFRMYKLEGFSAVLGLASWLVRQWLRDHASAEPRPPAASPPSPRPIFRPTRIRHQEPQQCLAGAATPRPPAASQGATIGATADEIAAWAKRMVSGGARRKGATPVGKCRVCESTAVVLVRRPLLFLDGPAPLSFCEHCQGRILSAFRVSGTKGVRLEAAIQTVRAS